MLFKFIAFQSGHLIKEGPYPRGLPNKYDGDDPHQVKYGSPPKGLIQFKLFKFIALQGRHLIKVGPYPGGLPNKHDGDDPHQVKYGSPPKGLIQFKLFKFIALQGRHLIKVSPYSWGGGGPLLNKYDGDHFHQVKYGSPLPRVLIQFKQIRKQHQP